MTKTYIGVKIDKYSGKWRCSIRKLGNQRRTLLKNEFDTAKEAAIIRDAYIIAHDHIPGVTDRFIVKKDKDKKFIWPKFSKGLVKIDKNDEANRRNFSKKEVKRLMEKFKKKKSDRWYGKNKK